MSNFNQYSDTPNQIINEGEQISLKFKRINESTAEIEWNIPKNTNGISQDDPIYNGILITIDNTPTNSSKFPINGTKYIPDPTGNAELHSGDKIDSALVIAFIDNDKITNKLIITDLDPESAYYVSAHALSSIYTYHTSGIHSYSVSYGDQQTPDTPAIQSILLSTTGIGIDPNQASGHQVGEVYTIEMTLDNDTEHVFEFNGIDTQTYQQIVDTWNHQVMLLDNPLQSPVIPNMGMYYYQTSTESLFQWNGQTDDLITVFVNDTQPNIVIVGDVWLQPSTNILHQWSGLVWSPISLITFNTEPNNPQCDDLWFDGTSMFKWTGSAWIDQIMFVQLIDPSLAIPLSCSSHWFDENTDELFVWDTKCDQWKPTLAQYSDTDPSTPAINHLWFNDDDQVLAQWDGSDYIQIPVNISATEPTTVPNNQHWYNSSTMELFVNNSGVFDSVIFLLWHYDPTNPQSGSKWWNSSNDTLLQWDTSTDTWNNVTPFFIQNTDPSISPLLNVGDVWTIDNLLYKKWDGSEWVNTCVINYPTNPENIPNNAYWYKKQDNQYYQLQTGTWVLLDPLVVETNPYMPTLGDFWYDSINDTLNEFDGIGYVNTPFSTVSLQPNKNFTYFDVSLNVLRKWNGFGWIDGEPKFTVRFSSDFTMLLLETILTGSKARVEVGHIRANVTGSVVGAFNSGSGFIPDFFTAMEPSAIPKIPRRGGDGLTGTPSYEQMGVGTDGSQDERRELIDSIRHQLGYPTVEVELTKQQMNYAIDGAIESIRKRSGFAYKRGFMFLDLEPRVQHYTLTDKRVGFNKIVSISEIHRISSAFLSHSEGQGVYGQLALQHLYQMGSFDLISFHMVSQYIETMEQLFASKIVFNWDEDDRKLHIFKDFYRSERVLMEVVVERTEQHLIKDRYLKSWIEKYALNQCRLMLSEIRGKFSSLPGSGGGVALNSAELSNRADVELMELYEQIDLFIANNPEEWGIGSTFIIG